MPKISVIIPNYNHVGFLVQRIESVLNQTYQDFEVIILDDCSTDNSKEIIEKYRGNSKISEIIYNDKNSGSTFKQWEKGIALATGEYIWIAESDDYAEPLFLETLLKYFNKYENIGIAYCNSNWIDDDNTICKSLSLHSESRHIKGKKEIESLLRFNTIQNVSSALLKADLAKKHVHQSSNFKACGDWLFYINILTESELVYTQKILNNFRWYHNNTSNAAEKSGLWSIEGSQLLSMPNLKKLKLPFRLVSVIIKDWLKRIWKSNNLNLLSKLRCTKNIFDLYLKSIL